MGNNNNLISIVILFALFVVTTIPTVIATDLLNNNPITINDGEDISCARKAQCCYLTMSGKDPCDSLSSTPEDGFIETSYKLIN